jgi:hypothetical protein
VPLARYPATICCFVDLSFHSGGDLICLQALFRNTCSLRAQLAAAGRCEEDILAEVRRGLSQDSAVVGAARMPDTFIRKGHRVGIPASGHVFRQEELAHLQRQGADTLEDFILQMDGAREVSTVVLHRVQRILVALLCKYAGLQTVPDYVAKARQLWCHVDYG